MLSVEGKILAHIPDTLDRASGTASPELERNHEDSIPFPFSSGFLCVDLTPGQAFSVECLLVMPDNVLSV